LSGFSKKSSNERLEDNKDLNETCKVLYVLKDMFVDLEPEKTEGTIKYFDKGKVFEYFRKTDDFNWMEERNKRSLTRRLKKSAGAIDKSLWSVQANGALKTYGFDTQITDDLFSRFISDNTE
jgi:hypothetical protein